MSAKITEFGTHLMSGDCAAAEKARHDAVSALEAHLDLTDELIARTMA